MAKCKTDIISGEPDTLKGVSPVRGRMLGNLPQKCGIRRRVFSLQIAGNMGSSLGTTINLNQQSAGEQLLTDLGRGAIQGTSQYIGQKAREVKVMLKAGYRIFLLPETNA